MVRQIWVQGRNIIWETSQDFLGGRGVHSDFQDWLQPFEVHQIGKPMLWILMLLLLKDYLQILHIPPFIFKRTKEKVLLLQIYSLSFLNICWSWKILFRNVAFVFTTFSLKFFWYLDVCLHCYEKGISHYNLTHIQTWTLHVYSYGSGLANSVFQGFEQDDQKHLFS